MPQSALHGCGDIFPLGITGTPIYDQRDGLVYAVAETTGYQHVLFGLSVADGKVEVERDLDQPTEANQPAYNQQRPALAIDDGRVYAAFGGLAGDCGAYIGGVVGVALNGKGPLVSWHTPTSPEGAVWGPTARSSSRTAACGSPRERRRGRQRPLRRERLGTALSPVLHRNGYFAPACWAADNASDLDLGSTEPVIAAGDPNTTFIVGKHSVGYLLSTAHLGGIGHEVASLDVCRAFGGTATSGSMVYEPCHSGGMEAVYVSAAQRKMDIRWRGPADGNGSPVLGGGAAWVTTYNSAGAPAAPCTSSARPPARSGVR